MAKGKPNTHSVTNPTVDTTETPETGNTTVTITNDEFRDYKHSWVKFVTNSRCYIEGVQLEPGQMVTLSAAGAYRQRINGNLVLDCEVKIPKALTAEQVKDLEDGDPKIGPTPKEFNLVQQGQGGR